MNNNRYLSPHELSERWGFHQESVRRMIRERRIPALRMGRRLRVSLLDVESFEAASRMIPRVAQFTEAAQ